MNRRPLVRMLLASAVTAAAVALAGCDSETLTKSTLRAQQPLSPKLVAEIEQRNMTKESPILVRIFKEEAELEVWKLTRGGRYALLKTYPICRWSGELGPKIREGDRQAPEGFYTITPGQMNPLSNYYLAFNMGYPNAFDRAHGRTGSQLMVHGDCSSRGCYAMTDEQMGEIYALAREAFFGGQKAFQVQAFPFRMTPKNMARHRANPNMAFWKTLKDGYDHFEVTRLEPKVDVCERRYVFNAAAPANASTPVSFSPSGKCPAYEVPADILIAVREKQARDKIRTAALVDTTPAAPIKTGTDGGMNEVYLAALNGTPAAGAIAGGVAATAHGTIPDHVNPPRPAHPVYASKQAVVQSTRMVLASAETTAETASASGGGFFDQLTQAIGFEDSGAAKVEQLAGQPRPVQTAARRAPASDAERQPVAAAAPPPQPTPRRPAEPSPPRAPVALAARKPEPREPASAKPVSDKPELRGTTATPRTAPVMTAAARQPARRPSARPSAASPAYGTPSTMMALTGPVIRGAQPTLRAGSFENRWSALR